VRRRGARCAGRACRRRMRKGKGTAAGCELAQAPPEHAQRQHMQRGAATACACRPCQSCAVSAGGAARAGAQVALCAGRAGGHGGRGRAAVRGHAARAPAARVRGRPVLPADVAGAPAVHGRVRKVGLGLGAAYAAILSFQSASRARLLCMVGLGLGAAYAAVLSFRPTSEACLPSMRVLRSRRSAQRMHAQPRCSGPPCSLSRPAVHVVPRRLARHHFGAGRALNCSHHQW